MPQRVGRYRVLSRIGRGGMGEVFVAEDPTLGRKVAIKVLSESVQEDEKMRARFLSEARTVASLNHPNIVTVHEAGLTTPEDSELPRDTPYIVMEYVEGRSLEELLDERPVTLKEGLRMAVEILDGLKAAHQRRLIHRDIKPSNLMVTGDGRVKILDFGLSKLLQENSEKSRLTAEGMIAGTMEYLSPEQALGRELDERTDLFSVGIVLYEMFAGEHPFHGQSATEKMANIVTQPSRDWPADTTVPPAIRSIVDKALQKDLDKRYPSAEAMLTDLEEARREYASVSSGRGKTMTFPQAVVTAEGSKPLPGLTRFIPSSGLRRWLRRSVRFEVLAMSVAAAAVLAGLGAFLFSRQQARRGFHLPPEGLKPEQLTASGGLESFPSVSPDGNSIAYSSDRTGSFEIYLKPLASGAREIAITTDGEQNTQPEWSPDGASIVFVSKRKGGIWIVPALGGVPRRLTEFGSYPAFSPNGKTIAFQSDPITDLSAGAFPAQPPSTIWTVPTAGGPPTRVTESGNPRGGHGAPTWSRDGERIVFVSYVRPTSELWVVPAQGGAPKLVSNEHPFLLDPVFDATGDALFVSTGGPEAPSAVGGGLWRLPVSARTSERSGEPREVMTLGLGTIRHTSVSTSGQKVVFSALVTASNLHVLSTSGPLPHTALPLTTGTGRNSRPAFSPDGTKLAYTVWRSGTDNDVWLMDADGRNPQPLTSDPAHDDYPAWYPDGKAIGFLTQRGGPNSALIYKLTLDSRKEDKLADLGAGSESPRMSPDARWIAYNSKAGGGTPNVWVSALDGSAARQLTFDKEFAGFPCWSPDGEWVAFEVKRGEDYHIAQIPRAGGAVELLTSKPGLAWPYSFTPDGREVLFAGFRDGYWNVWAIDRKTKVERAVTKYTKLGAYVRYPTASPAGGKIAYELAETTGNVWLINLPR